MNAALGPQKFGVNICPIVNVCKLRTTINYISCRLCYRADLKAHHQHKSASTMRPVSEPNTKVQEFIYNISEALAQQLIGILHLHCCEETF